MYRGWKKHLVSGKEEITLYNIKKIPPQIKQDFEKEIGFNFHSPTET
jgi:hypothetical protein